MDVIIRFMHFLQRIKFVLIKIFVSYLTSIACSNWQCLLVAEIDSNGSIIFNYATSIENFI